MNPFTNPLYFIPPTNQAALPGEYTQEAVNELIIPQPYKDILLNYLQKIPSSDFELGEALKNLEVSTFEAAFQKIVELYFKDNDDDLSEYVDEIQKIIQEFFFRGMSIIQNDLEKQKLRDGDNFINSLKQISPKTYIGRSNECFKYFNLITGGSNHFLPKDPKEQVEKILEGLEEFKRFPNILNEINSFYHTCSSPSLSKNTRRSFWQNPSEAIRLLDILLSYSYIEIAEELSNAASFSNNKETFIEILRLFKKFSIDTTFINHSIRECFKDVQSFDYKNKSLLCFKPEALLVELCTALSIKTVVFVEPDLGLLKINTLEIISKTPVENTIEELQPDLKTNLKKRKRETSSDSDSETSIKAAKQQKQNDPNLLEIPSNIEFLSEDWKVFFENLKKMKVSIDLSFLKNFHLEHLLLLSGSEPVHILLNAQLLKNNPNSPLSFNCPFLKMTWHIDSPINEYQLEKIQNSNVVELKIDTAQCSAEEIQEILTRINPEKLTLFTNNYNTSNITIPAVQHCPNLKKVNWNMSLETPQARAAFSYLVETGRLLSYQSVISFNPRENIQEENDEIKSDVIHSLMIVEYLLRNPKNSEKMFLEMLVLSESDVHLLQNFPLAGLISLPSSTYDLSRKDSLPLLKSFEQELVHLNKNDGVVEQCCSANRFQQIFTPKTAAECPWLALAFWLSATRDAQTAVDIALLLDVFDILIPHLEKQPINIVNYYEMCVNLIQKAQHQKYPIPNLQARLDFLYKTTIKKELLNNTSKLYLNNLLQINPPEISEEYFKLLAWALKNRLLVDLFDFSHLPIVELKKLLPLLISIKPPYYTQLIKLINLIPIDELSPGDMKYWVPIVEGLQNNNLNEKIKTHFDKCYLYLSPETKKSYATAILNKKCSFELFEHAFRILINNSVKFPGTFIGFHFENLLKFLCKYPVDSIIITKMNNSLNSPNVKSSFIDQIVLQCFQTNLTAEQEKNFYQIYENYLAIPKRSMPLLQIKFETVAKRVCEISKTHSYFPSFILSWLIEFAVKSENPTKECVHYIETIPSPLSEDSWSKIFAHPILKQEIVDRLLANSIINRPKNPQALLQALAKNISISKEDEITKFIKLANKLLSPSEHDYRLLISLPLTLIKPIFVVILKENMISRYSLGISYLLPKCLEEVIRNPNDLSAAFFSILYEFKKTKKECVSKHEKGSYKHRIIFIHHALAVELQRLLTLPDLANNIFGFCLKFLENSQDQLLGGDFEPLKEVILQGLLNQINNGFSPSSDLIKTLSNLLLNRNRTAIPLKIQNQELANCLITDFLIDWEASTDNQVLTAANYSILLDCLAFPRPEQEQIALSKILSNFGILPFNSIPPLSSVKLSQNPLFCSALLDIWINQPPSPQFKNYVYNFIFSINSSGFFEANKKNILHLINLNSNSNTIVDFDRLFPELTNSQLSDISSQLVHEKKPSQFNHSNQLLGQQKILFYLSRYSINMPAIKQKASEIKQVEIILPPGGEKLDLKKYIEYFKMINKKVVKTYASPEWMESAKKQNITYHELFLQCLKNLISVLTRNEAIELSPHDATERRNLYGVIIHDLKATLFHIHAKVQTLNKDEAAIYLTQNAQIFLTLAQTGAKGNCIYPYQKAAEAVYRMAVPHSNIKVDMDNIEGKMTKKIIEFQWICFNKVIATDPLSVNIHRRNAYIKLFENNGGPEIGSTKIIKEDPLLLAELEILKKQEKEIFSKVRNLFNVRTCYNFICQNWGHTETDPKESYNNDDLNAWLQRFTKSKKLSGIPYKAAWSKTESIPWPAILEILSTTGCFKKRFPNESSLFNLNCNSSKIDE